MKIWSVGLMVCVCTQLAFSSTGTFEDLSLTPESSWSGNYPIDSVGGTGETTSFNTGGVSFNNFSDGDWFFWSGFAYSNITDNTTPGFGNQFSAFPGSGSGGSDNYGIGFVGITPTISFANETIASSIDITNTTYAGLSMQNGDTFSKQFGGVSGNDEDWFLLTITGKDASNQTTGTFDFYLADYRFSDNSQDYIVDEWVNLDLSSLGLVKSLEFSLSSSDVGQFGMNTPAYFAVDNVVPEPLSLSLLSIGSLVVIRKRKML